MNVVTRSVGVRWAARLRSAAPASDQVETEAALRENGPAPVEEWLRAAPYLIANRATRHLDGEEMRALRRTLGGAA